MRAENKFVKILAKLLHSLKRIALTFTVMPKYE